MTPEGKVKNEVKKWLKLHKIWFYCPVQNGMGVVGIPDFICCMGGRFLAIETKAPGKLNNTTPNQDRQLANIRFSGGLAVVVDGTEYLDKMLETLTKARQ
jgi:hypothetical protein